MVELLHEKVKIAEEEAQVHARKNLQAEEEIRRVRASAVKVRGRIGVRVEGLECFKDEGSPGAAWFAGMV